MDIVYIAIVTQLVNVNGVETVVYKPQIEVMNEMEAIIHRVSMDHTYDRFFKEFQDGRLPAYTVRRTKDEKK